METVVHSEHYNSLGLSLHAGGASVGGLFPDYSVAAAQHGLPPPRDDGRCSDGHHSRAERAANPASEARQDSSTRHESRHDRSQGSVVHENRSSRSGPSPNGTANTASNHSNNNNSNNSNNVSSSNTNHHSNNVGGGNNNAAGSGTNSSGNSGNSGSSGGQAQRVSSSGTSGNGSKRGSTDSAGGSQGKRPGRKCGTHLRFADIDAAMLQWMLDMNAYKVPLSDSTIQAKAKQLAQVSTQTSFTTVHSHYPFPMDIETELLVVIGEYVEHLLVLL